MEALLIELFLDVSPPLEVDHGVGVVHGRVLNLVLLRQVVQRRDGRLQPRDGQKGGQIGRVRSDDDEAEKPPFSQILLLMYQKAKQFYNKQKYLYSNKMVQLFTRWQRADGRKHI